MASSDCLLARAISMPQKTLDTDPQIDSLAAQLDATISLKKSPMALTPEAKEERKKRVEEIISPADHLALQSLRSSALARKTNTTAKFSRDCRNLFADLLYGDELKKEEKASEPIKKMEKETTTKDDQKLDKDEKKKEKAAKLEENEKNKAKEEEKKDGELIARGPIRANYIIYSAHPYHPYSANQAAEAPQLASINAAAPQSTLLNQNSLNQMAPHGYGGYECGLPSNWSSSGWSAGGGRDSVLSSPSSTPDTTAGSLDMALMMMGGSGGRSELPDDLSDFILEYSRRYSPILSRKTSYSDGGSPRSSTTADFPCGGESPLSAPQSSPAAPRGGAISGPRESPLCQMQTMTKDGSTDLGSRPAKDRLRAMIRSEDMDNAWAWTCKCIQRHPGAMTFQDADRDTLLHIVTSHLDLAKIYALVEQMLKLEVKPGEMPPFDMPNGVGETPLMVAVQKRQCQVVDYLLEVGVSPNVQSTRMERDMPLHYAASRGMTAIVLVLCADSRTNLNAQNGMGLSPLLCAFKSHGVLEEESQSRVDNFETAKVLLKCGADPMVADSTNGQTLVHYAVERMDERLIELLRAHLDEQKLGQLVNQANFCGETPMNALKGMEELEQEQKSRMCLALITCGADASGEE